MCDDFISVLNDVIGPVMRGPSSSHTAASHRIGRIARDLLGEPPASALFVFDPDGSYGSVYRQQGVDLALVSGLLERPITDEFFKNSLFMAGEQGINILFELRTLKNADHPNIVDMFIEGKSGRKLEARARSTGGGLIQFDSVNGRPVVITGKSHHCLVEARKQDQSLLRDILAVFFPAVRPIQARNGSLLVNIRSAEPFPADFLKRMKRELTGPDIRTCSPVFYPQRGEVLFRIVEDMVDYTEKNALSLGEAVLDYESRLLGRTREDILNETISRLCVMTRSVEQGLDDSAVDMALLPASASKILTAEKQGHLPIGGLHARAAARAMAAMHAGNSSGVVCAAPTGGSAGVIPGVIVTLQNDRGLEERKAALCLLAAGGIGLLVARRATFAAEIAGCQVEIGAAGAMAAAAVIEFGGGTARQALDAAAVAFQNTMGSVCDLVQGMCEIPCHTRNAAAAASAFVCADLIIGGYVNPIPLDETIDAVLAVGQAMPSELRVTSLGGLAVCPSALSLKHRR